MAVSANTANHNPVIPDMPRSMIISFTAIDMTILLLTIFIVRFDKETTSISLDGSSVIRTISEESIALELPLAPY